MCVSCFVASRLCVQWQITEFVTPNITPYSDLKYVCVVFVGFQTLCTAADLSVFVTPEAV